MHQKVGFLFTMLLCLLIFCLFQLLLIAPVYGRKKPQLSLPDISKEKQGYTSHDLKVIESEGSKDIALEVNKARLESIVKRPSKASSKVPF